MNDRNNSFRPPSAEEPQPGSQRPWPVYGESGEERSGAGEQLPPRSARPGAVPPGPVPSFSQQPGFGGPAGYQEMTGPLPSRAGAIWLLVAGLVTMFVIAPAVLFAVAFTGVDLSAWASGMTANGNTVVVDESGTLTVAGGGGATLSECTLTGSAGSETLYAGSQPFVTGTGLAPGSYVIDCGPEGAQGLIILPESEVAGLMRGATRGMGIASVVGFAGLGMTIGGIAWLVSRNRARREYRQAQWRQPPSW